jgi:hypothetical protein
VGEREATGLVAIKSNEPPHGKETLGKITAAAQSKRACDHPGAMGLASAGESLQKSVRPINHLVQFVNGSRVIGTL